MRSVWKSIAVATLAASLSGCAVDIENQPVNKPFTGATPTDPHNPPPQHQAIVVGVAFSGGGTRAAAFSFGVLKALAATNAPDSATPLLGDVDFVSGVSGGSVTAAYFGYRGAAALGDFRERFLTQDVEAHLHTSPLDPENWLRWLEGGGVNDRRGMQAWLDQNLFGGETFAALERLDRPIVWINASDIYNHTPFAFDHETFDALCSDLTQLPISEAVAASAAVPIAFAPIVIQSYSGACQYKTPDWVTRALADSTSPSLQDYAQAISNYHDPQAQKYVKLLDGGLVDNYGLAALTLRREEHADTAYAPLTPEQAVSLQKLLFVLVDSGQSTDNSWVMTPGGPNGVNLAMAAINTPLEASKRASFELFSNDIKAWHDRLVQYRCKELSPADVLRLRGSLDGWKCNDVHFYVATISFDLLDPAERDRLSQLPTTLSLPAADVDALIQGGAEALSRSGGFREFLETSGAKVSLLTP